MGTVLAHTRYNRKHAMATEGLAPEVAAIRQDFTGGGAGAGYRDSGRRAVAGRWAVDLAGTINLPYGVTPTSFSIRTHLMDHLLHGWDLLAATEQLGEAPDHLVTVAQEIIDSLPADVAENPRDFARATPTGPATPRLDRLAARCDRMLRRDH